MGTNCAPLVADLFLFCYERDFIKDLSYDNQVDILRHSTQRLDMKMIFLTLPILILKEWSTKFIHLNCNLIRLILHIPRPPFWLHLSFSNGFVSSKIYDKRDDFDFDIVNFPFLDGDVPRLPSYGVYISQLIRFARVCSHVDDFNTHNKCLTAKLLKQGYRYHKLRKAFSKLYRRHNELVSKFNAGLKSILHQGQNFMLT